jgi:hypothetical protein
MDTELLPFGVRKSLANHRLRVLALAAVPVHRLLGAVTDGLSLLFTGSDRLGAIRVRGPNQGKIRSCARFHSSVRAPTRGEFVVVSSGCSPASRDRTSGYRPRRLRRGRVFENRAIESISRLTGGAGEGVDYLLCTVHCYSGHRARAGLA